MTRIAIPSDDRHHVAEHFGHAAGFLVFRYDGGELASEYREVGPPPPGSGGGGDEMTRHQRVLAVIRDCDVVIAASVGGGMLSALYDAGIEVALSTVGEARKAAEMLVNDILPASTGSGCCSN